MIDKQSLRKWRLKGRFPAHISLHFALLEDAYLSAVCGYQRDTPTMPVHLILRNL